MLRDDARRLMYESFFGLKDLPFRLTPDPAYLFMSAKHREAFAHLLYGVNEGSGFVAITGEVGAGKTTLIRALLRETDDKVVVTYIVNPVLTSTELLQTINAELGLPSATSSRKELIEELNVFLRDTAAKGGRTVVIVDEAQNLDPVVLEQLRLLSNLETETEKLIQIVLVGQPELRELLERHDLRQLNQRVTVRWHLEALDAGETAEYIRHRLRVAGASGELFERRAVDLIHQYSQGVPRLISILAHRSLLVGYTRNAGRVGTAEVAAAAAELGHGNGPVSARRRPWFYPLAAALVAAAVLGVGASWRLARTGSERTEAAPAAAPAAAASDTVPAPASPDHAPAAAAEPEPAVAVAGTDIGEAEAYEAASGAGAGAAAAVRAARAETLAERLSQGDSFDTAREGVSRLLELWNVAPLTEAETASGSLDLDAIASARGLRYVSVAMTSALLAVLNLPAVVELEVPGGGLRHVLVEGLSADGSRLRTGGGVGIPRARFESWWNGRAHILWKDEARLGPDLGPGSGGPSVAKLQSLLSEAGLYEGPATGRYDEATEQAVRDFQAARGVLSDGVVGPITQILLYDSLHRYVRPRLSGDAGRGAGLASP